MRTTKTTVTAAAPNNPGPLPPSLPAKAFQEWLDIPEGGELDFARCLDPESHIKAYWMERTRPDGRLFTQGRPTRVVESMLRHSVGSALVSQGGSKVLVAMTVQIGQPSPERPDEGEVNVQVSGTGGRNLDSRQPAPHWEVLQSWLQRVMEQNGIPSQLNLLAGKACIRLVTTVLILEDGGGLRDVSLLACMAAWKDTRLPVMGRDLKESQGKLWWTQGGPFSSLQTQKSDDVKMETGTGIPVLRKQYRISLSMGVWVHPESKTTHLLVDPSIDEEEFLEGNLTIVISLATGKLQVEYTGKVALSASDLAFASKLAKGHADELAKILS